MEYDNTNRGVLFKNERKEKPTQPDLKGSINIDGKEYWLSGWSKISSKGEKILTMSATAKEQQSPARQASAKQAPAATFDADFDENLPF